MIYPPEHNYKLPYTNSRDEGLWLTHHFSGWLGSGLTDCNGVEIFEGDIVKCWIEESNPRETEIYVVAFENGSFVLAGTTDFINDIETLDIEVIGHIAEETP